MPRAPSGLTAQLEPIVPFIHHDPWNDRDSILRGRFCFLNRAADHGRPVRWDAPGEPLLWRFNLHYFHYLHLLEPDEQTDLCRDWMESNPPGDSPAWHPYPTSLRIVNWCKAGPTDRGVLESLYTQAAWLYRNVETHVYGNHLLENARALILAGRMFGTQGEAPAWLDRGLSVFERQLTEQILGDGCHFERSPMYQALMLEAAADVMNVLGEDHPMRSRVGETIASMADALISLTHPDGGIALLNDATLEIAPRTETLTSYVERLTGHRARRLEGLSAAGYYVAVEPDVYLVVDGGAAGPDYLMAHAHADIFSYELSVAGKRFVVDPGVFEYAPGEMRDYVRSTRAHSTVTVDNRDQIECWGSFRVGRRSGPQDVRFEVDNDSWMFSGDFPGYADIHGDGILHRRTISMDRSSRTMTVRDHVDGSGRHLVSSRIHLHPDVEIVGSNPVELRREGVVCLVESATGSFATESGWYCPEFGRRIQSTVLLLEHDAELPHPLSYTFRFE